MTQPWSTVVGQWTPANLYKRVSYDGVSNLLGTVNTSATNALVQTVGIDLMTAFYRQKLMERFTREYPDTLAGIQLEYTRRLQMATEFQNYAGKVSQANEPVSQIGLTGVSVGAFPLGSSVFTATQGVYGQVVNLKPGYWFIDSSSTPINSSLLAGQANPGDYLGDLNPNVQIGVYLNRGTLAVPNWVRADSQSLIDYIYNPTEILECGYLRIMANLKVYAQEVPKGATIEWSYTYMPVAIKTQVNMATDYESTSFGLIQVDRSANGIISDYDKDASKVTKWIV